MKANYNIICIDDDVATLGLLKSILQTRRDQLSNQTFLTSRLALSSIASAPADIAVVELSQRKGAGLEIVAEMRAKNPDTLFILAAANADFMTAVISVNEFAIFRFITKPITKGELDVAIDMAITEINLRRLNRLWSMSHVTVDRISRAVLYVADDMTMTYANRTALELIAKTRCLQLMADNKLRVVAPKQQDGFRAFLGELKIQQAGDQASIFRFTDDTGNVPLTVSALYHHGAAPAGPFFSLLLSDPSRLNSSVRDIAVALGLRPSEARIVQSLAGGASIEDAALAAGVSVSTARTYLKVVFQKTGVSRQAELVRLVFLTAA